MFVLIIIGIMLSLDVAFWLHGLRSLRPLRRSRLWQVLFSVFMAFQLGGLLWVMGMRFVNSASSLPAFLLMLVYLWHLLILPVSALVWVLSSLVAALAGLFRRLGRPPAREPSAIEGTLRVLPSRREVLIGAAVALPPLLTGGAAGASAFQMEDLRIRRINLAIAGLPDELNGFTIAHVTDVHTGRFTGPPRLRQIRNAVNDLDADLVAVTGDLIDFSLKDLPHAMEMAGGFKGRHGVYMVEGNHDLFESREDFETTVRRAGLDLLLNDVRPLTIRGQRVQVMGLKWGGPRMSRDPQIVPHMRQLLAYRQAGAFPILLAHHPHAFDAAIDADIPLTLAGHTHGGQLMLTEHIGPGPLLFKYWTGLYRNGNHSLVVANGAGHWFPLRINAPAEIIHLTLTPAPGSA